MRTNGLKSYNSKNNIIIIIIIIISSNISRDKILASSNIYSSYIYASIRKSMNFIQYFGLPHYKRIKYGFKKWCFYFKKILVGAFFNKRTPMQKFYSYSTCRCSADLIERLHIFLIIKEVNYDFFHVTYEVNKN